MTPLRRIVLLAWLLAATGCAATAVNRPQDASPDSATFVVVRHAEKTNDDPRDPGLSAAGTTRARALAARLADRSVVAVYATPYRRTRDTAAPTAADHQLDVQSYDAATPPAAFVDTLRRVHARGTVLVVGHSNTVPAIVSALCGCAVAPIQEDAYDRIHEVRIDASGTPSLRQDLD